MKGYGFPLSRMLVFVVVAGIGFAALKIGSTICMKGLYFATIVSLLTAVIAAWVRGRRTGAFWFGFAVFGWGYLLLAVPPSMEFQRRNSGNLLPVVRQSPVLPSPGLVEWIAEAVAEPLKPPTPPSSPGTGIQNPAFWQASGRWDERRANATVIGHLILVWASGGVGGLTALVLSKSRRPNGSP
jgi:hypothetical protein